MGEGLIQEACALRLMKAAFPELSGGLGAGQVRMSLQTVNDCEAVLALLHHEHISATRHDLPFRPRDRLVITAPVKAGFRLV